MMTHIAVECSTKVVTAVEFGSEYERQMFPGLVTTTAEHFYKRGRDGG